MDRWAYTLLALWAILLFSSPGRLRAADITLDSGCTLSDAIKAANSDSGQGACAAGFGPDTITLTADLRLQAELPAISSDIAINGAGHAISGAEAYRIFHVAAGGKLSISNLHLLEGRANDCPYTVSRGSGVFFDDETSCGGAIVNLGSVSIRNSSFSKHLSHDAIFNFHQMDINDSNFHDIIDRDRIGCCRVIRNWGELRISNASFSGIYTLDSGGAIRNEGRLWISDSRFLDNSAWEGGAIYNLGWLHISGSQFAENRATRRGGAILNQSRLHIKNSGFEKNEAADGGAIHNIGSAELTVRGSSFLENSSRLGAGGAIHSAFRSVASIAKSSFVGNFARNGGAIFNSYQSELSITDSSLLDNSARDDGGAIQIFHGKAALTHVTIARNAAERGGGPFAGDEYYPSVSLRNSIIAGNQPRDCFGRIEVNLGNLDTDGFFFAAITGDPAFVEGPAPDDGPARYLELSPGSPAIGAADPRFCSESDQIGRARPAGGACDIGAIQSSPAAPALSACQVTTTHDLNFRAAPGGRVIGGVPANTRLAALARAAAWFHVEHEGRRGWLSADYLIAQGDC